jgi:hypothetical protein
VALAPSPVLAEGAGVAGVARVAPTLLPPVEPEGPAFWTCVGYGHDN